MSELTRKKDELSSTVAAYKEMFTTYSELLQLLTSKISFFK